MAEPIRLWKKEKLPIETVPKIEIPPVEEGIIRLWKKPPEVLPLPEVEIPPVEKPPALPFWKRAARVLAKIPGLSWFYGKGTKELEKIMQEPVKTKPLAEIETYISAAPKDWQPKPWTVSELKKLWDEQTRLVTVRKREKKFEEIYKKEIIADPKIPKDYNATKVWPCNV